MEAVVGFSPGPRVNAISGSNKRIVPSQADHEGSQYTAISMLGRERIAL